MAEAIEANGQVVGFESSALFYESWQEASRAARKLRIEYRAEYQRRYKEDPLLPAAPEQVYWNWPGWEIFLTGRSPRFYPTWYEAAIVARSLGARSDRDYNRQPKQLYRKDCRLPAHPELYYKETWPGWPAFLGTVPYLTWQQAAEATRLMDINTEEEYRARYSENPHLRLSLDEFYPDFPGWRVFLGKPAWRFYPMWQMAAKAVQSLGIKTVWEYDRRYNEDPYLYSHPADGFYKDWPGWEVFLGKKSEEHS